MSSRSETGQRSSPAKPCVLTVDDEPELVALLSRALEKFGLTAVAHSSSLAALEAFRTDPERFDLVVTDNTMPYLTGLELAASIRAIRPDLPILMVTGVAVRDSSDISSFLAKPFSVHHFKHAIEALLNGLRA
jgi:two-component system cell cycle sensor histidine kinase/response regulator CckA